MKSVVVQAPSNIALIKYWGKSDPKTQWPANSSLSMTLSKARTCTRISLSDGQDQVFFAGQELSKDSIFFQKVNKHLMFLRDLLEPEMPAIRVETNNFFPADCGIASSASGLAALTVAVLGFYLGASSLEDLSSYGYNLDYLSRLSRMGSGSAGRSLFGGFVLWDRGHNPYTQKVSQIFDENHWLLTDGIALVDTRTKAVGSSEGHAQASSSLLFEPRTAGIEEKISRLVKAIKRKDFEEFGLIVEEDSLSMHGVMFSGDKKLQYMTEKTSQLLAWLRKKRQSGKIWAYGTVDAGPNVHILVQNQDRKNLEKELAKDWPHIPVLWDQVGSGIDYQ